MHVVGWRPPAPAAARKPAPPRLSESPQEQALREIAAAAGGRLRQVDSPERLRRDAKGDVHVRRGYWVARD